MINKNTIFSCALSLIISAMPIVSCADITSNAVLDKEMRTVNISGKIDSFASNTNITLTAVKRIDDKGLEANKIYNLSEKQKSTLYVKQMPLSSDGTFSFTFTPNGKSGKYDYYVNCTDNKDAYKDSFTFIDVMQEEEMLQVLNEADADKIFTDVSEGKDGVLCEINGLLKLISNDDLNKISAKIYEEDAFETFSDSKAFIARMAAICAFNQSSDFEIILNNAENLAIDEHEAFKTLSEKDSNFKLKVSSRLEGISLDDDFVKKLSEAVYLTMIETAGNYTEINSIIDSVNKYTDIDVSAYYDLKNTNELDKMLVGNSYTAQALSKAISEYEPERTSGSSGGSSSKRGSSSNRGSISSVAVMPSITDASANDKQSVFKDIDSNHWAYESIEVLYKKGVFNGDSDGNFRADNYITREEFVKVAMESFSLPKNNASHAFSDVPKDSWSAGYIRGALALGIVSGRNENEFAPKDNITREEAAHILYNIILLENRAIPKLNEIKQFTDIDKISEFARGSFLTFCAGGIINGYEDKTLRPQNHITRGECAKIITNMLKNIR